MICKNCRDGGDASKINMKQVSAMMHAKCNYIGCYCQHKI